jgi:ectoine hydroxylase-related dioxygenase (phytanoyl-CoA dioxygenase family)
VFPALLARRTARVADRSLANAIAAAAEGYSFPTNLDRDQPVGGLAPETQAELLARAVREGWDADSLAKELAGYAERRRTGES